MIVQTKQYCGNLFYRAPYYLAPAVNLQRSVVQLVKKRSITLLELGDVFLINASWVYGRCC